MLAALRGSLFGVLLIVAAAAPARAEFFLANPHWDITLTDYGFSDVLFYNDRAAVGQCLPEMLSGEWAAAVGYDGIEDGLGFPLAESSMWIEPQFLYPDWSTNSAFSVVSPGTLLPDFDADGLPEGFSVVSNGTLEIRIDSDMLDTGAGTPMGLRDDGFLASDRYVLLQTYTLTNVSGGSLYGLRFYQLLHGHPANTEVPTVRAVYDPTVHPGVLSGFRYDITQFVTSSGAPDGSPTGFRFFDLIGLSSAVAPQGWTLGHFRGHAFGKPPDDDVEPDGDGDGTHYEVERDSLENEETYGPDEVAGAMRWDLGVFGCLGGPSHGLPCTADPDCLGGICVKSLAASGSVSLQLLLAVRSEAVPLPSILATSGEQRCITVLNKDARSIAKAHAQRILTCIKKYTRGIEPDADICKTSDPAGTVKIARAEAKAVDHFDRMCFEGPAAIGPQSVTQIADAAAAKEAALFARAFGETLNDLTQASTSVKEAICIHTVAKALFKCQDAKMKAFMKCKKLGLRAGTITSAQEIQDECLGTGSGAQPDPNGRIAKKCTDTIRPSIFTTVAKKCRSAAGVDLVRAFGNGECATEAGTGGTALEACLERIVECEVCEMWNAADGLTRNCDLFDNGVEDDSCGRGMGACDPA